MDGMIYIRMEAKAYQSHQSSIISRKPNAVELKVKIGWMAPRQYCKPKLCGPQTFKVANIMCVGQSLSQTICQLASQSTDLHPLSHQMKQGERCEQGQSLYPPA